MTRLAAPTVRANVATTSVPSLEIRTVLLTILSIDVFSKSDESSEDGRHRPTTRPMRDAVQRPEGRAFMTASMLAVGSKSSRDDRALHQQT
jgi:hypothetical protein